MKKINKDGIRALIMETLEEMSLGEAKKKVEEADEEAFAEDPGKESDGGVGSHNRNYDPGPEGFGEPVLSLDDNDIQTFTNAVKAYNSDDEMSKAGAAVHLKPLAEKIKAIVKAAEDRAKNKPA
jgi:hypothetical protein